MHQALAMKLVQACHFVLQWKEGQLKVMFVSKREKARSEYFKNVDLFSVPLNLQPLNLSLPKSEYQTSLARFGVEFILIH